MLLARPGCPYERHSSAKAADQPPKGQCEPNGHWRRFTGSDFKWTADTGLSTGDSPTYSTAAPAAAWAVRAQARRTAGEPLGADGHFEEAGPE